MARSGFRVSIGLVLAVPLCLVQGMVANAAPADIAACDGLAAHPTDPDKPAEVNGVTVIAGSDIPAAVKACKAATAATDAPRRIWMELGRAYEFGGQPTEAANAYRKAAKAGNTTAMAGLGVLLIKGDGVRKNVEEARTLIETAAKAGDVEGMINLAAIYGAGVGVKTDVAMARNWYAKAAAANSSEAMFQLGLMTEDGDGGPKDDVAAKALFEKAAALDHADALERLGAYAEAGRAGEKDPKAAIAYYKRAAALGSEDAAKALERLRCPFGLKDRAGKSVGRICSDGG
ncbi:sel1 repeat family protein [Bradyrhizobium manausense]|uniref:tetratricopeptide repeat protein n=1 Tax=Bradyrhizobium TaxID=374 RepID=UPI001BA828C1|nr:MULTISPECIES: tetratricopeptide repeat protein [Bradyrhizobium]MBR0831237.1 sel1 repeat family protein [Bradyrhizobium manausense]UVO32707.1 sel1 repeat family protein [Bradyrhizobium arachidis]